MTPPSSVAGELLTRSQPSSSSPSRMMKTFPRANRTRATVVGRAGGGIGEVSLTRGSLSSSLRRRLRGYDDEDNDEYNDIVDDDEEENGLDDQGERYNDEEDEQALVQFERRSSELLRGSGANRKLAQHCPQCRRMVDLAIKAKGERDSYEEMARKCEEQINDLRCELISTAYESKRVTDPFPSFKQYLWLGVSKRRRRQR